MKIKILYLAAIFFITVGFISARGINKCYLNFEGNENFTLSSSDRKEINVTSSTEFKISKNKTIRVHFIDTYEAEYINKNGEIILKQEIELTGNKRYKEYVLDHYNRMAKHHTTHHNEEIKLFSFKIDSTEVHGFTSENADARINGRYLIFPTDKMVIYLDFYNSKVQPYKSSEEFIPIRNSLIKSYLDYIYLCGKK